MDALIVYTSNTGNTKKVANAIKEGLETNAINVKTVDPKQAVSEDFFSYDLVCVGSPSIQWSPAKPISDLLKTKLDQYRNQGKILLEHLKCLEKHFNLLHLFWSTTGIEKNASGKTIRVL